MTGLVVLIVIIVLVIVIGGIILALAPRKEPIQAGREEMIGKVGEVRKTIDPWGEVFINGEIWKAFSKKTRIEKGERAKVKAFKGLTLIVEKTEEEEY
ncbi:MAG: hypothetical protein M1269_13340 [Chloroflexi bacterium]|nr:hypothetical protein [Chloroflexota bacterium]